MTFPEKLANRYEEADILNEDHGIYLVRNTDTGGLYVKKIINVYSREIYIRLLKNDIVGVPRIIEAAEEDDRLTVIEEYIGGSSLRELIDRGSLTLSDVLSYVMQICATLRLLHDQKPPIIHRDIKPSNIIIDTDGQAILLDFNAAKFSSGEGSRDTVLLGTKGYAAPEQYGFGSSTALTDIYAMGILLKEMCSSVNGYAGELDEIISDCTKIDPKDRISSASVLRNRLRAAAVRLQKRGKTAPGTVPYIKWLPPGFRSLRPVSMILSAIGYYIIAEFCFTFNVPDRPDVQTNITRWMLFFWFLALIFIPANYLDMQKLFPLCKARKQIWRITGTVIFTLIVMGLIFMAATEALMALT